MGLPGAVETVREGIENEREEPGSGAVSRRAALAGGVGGGGAGRAGPRTGAGLARAPPGRKRRHKDLTHVFTAGFPVYVGNPPTRRTLTTVEANGFCKQEWTFDEHSHTHGRARAFHKRRTAGDRVAAARALCARCGDRHLGPCRE